MNVLSEFYLPLRRRALFVGMWVSFASGTMAQSGGLADLPKDTFCTFPQGAVYLNPRIGPLLIALPFRSTQGKVLLDPKREVACDSEEAKAASSAFLVPILRSASTGVRFEIDAWGPEYWEGDWRTLRKRSFEDHVARAKLDHAIRHEELTPARLTNQARFPGVWVTESSLYFGQGRTGNLHYIVYYTIAGDYAIEIGVSSPDKGALMGSMDLLERNVACSSCKVPDGAVSGK